MMHVDLIGPYKNSIRQQQSRGANIKNGVVLTSMNIIDPAMGWFDIVKVLMFDIDNAMGGNDEYIYKSYVRAGQLYNNTCLIRYPQPHKVVFGKWV